MSIGYTIVYDQQQRVITVREAGGASYQFSLRELEQLPGRTVTTRIVESELTRAFGHVSPRIAAAVAALAAQ